MQSCCLESMRTVSFSLMDNRFTFSETPKALRMGRLPSLNATSKKALVGQLCLRLANHERWDLSAFLRIYPNQPADDQRRDTALEVNGIGFTASVAEILSSFDRQYQRRGCLSSTQTANRQRRIPSCLHQIVKHGDTTWLEFVRRPHA